VQKRIDELVREREEWKRAALREIQPPPPITQPVSIPDTFADLPKPDVDKYESYDAYIADLTNWQAETKLRQYQIKQQIEQRQTALNNWFDTAHEKYSDFSQVFGGAACTDPMADVLLASPHGVEMAYYLGQNISESRRIANLPPTQQAYEMGRLEAKLINQSVPQRSKTKAPPAIVPLGGNETPTKKPDDMSHEEYKSWRLSGGGR
jgi:hypothetical protein